MQTGKGLHRLAGGTHKRWEQYDSNGKLKVVELHKYPASRGLILWHLGSALARAARPLEAHLAAVREYLGAGQSDRKLEAAEGLVQRG